MAEDEQQGAPSAPPELDQEPASHKRAAPPTDGRSPDASEVIGRGLGLAFKRFKKTKVYQRNVEAYHKELEKD